MRKQFNIATGTLTEHEDAPVTWEVPTPTYSELRALAYKPLAEQLDYIYHNGIEAWKANMILPVKTKYPKEGE